MKRIIVYKGRYGATMQITIADYNHVRRDNVVPVIEAARLLSTSLLNPQNMVL